MSLRHFVKPITHSTTRRCSARGFSALREKTLPQQHAVSLFIFLTRENLIGEKKKKRGS